MDELFEKHIQYRTTERQDLFIRFYTECRQIRKACRQAGIRRWTYYSWLKKYPDFIKRCDEARKENLIQNTHKSDKSDTIGGFPKTSHHGTNGTISDLFQKPPTGFFDPSYLKKTIKAINEEKQKH